MNFRIVAQLITSCVFYNESVEFLRNLRHMSLA
uniref:Uncharacterized protein n=1 Tax=Anguilla anguilla TaxID=7936 RepID=A0A0E9U706_ANGAN